MANHSLTNKFENKVRPCIDLIDSLRALGMEKDLHLPSIAVIGDQSSGKSSVLEALSGVCLPRGNGIVTRCPLELRLKKSPEGSSWYGKISYQNKKAKILNPAEVEQEVRKAQNRIAGEGKGIRDELITLEIGSPNGPDLTLIDLPGITRVALPDQPPDIEQQIKRIIMKYVARKETINLVVVPSNVDIATTEALQMAKQVDPNGERTVGILTKPDLVDKGVENDVVGVVRNQIYILKKGYTIVKCRGQSEIVNRVSLGDAINNERAFFENHQFFRVLLDEGYATISTLAVKLTTELVEHIFRALPFLMNQVNIKLKEAQDGLNQIGIHFPETDSDRLHFLVKKIMKFNEGIQQASEGEEVTIGHLKLCNEIRKHFNSWEQLLKESTLKFSAEITSQENAYETMWRGQELKGLNNYRTIAAIIKTKMITLEGPAVQKLNDITALVRSTFSNIATNHFQEFPNLCRTAKAMVEKICQVKSEEAKQTILTHFKMEGRVIFCLDSTYGSSLNAVRNKKLNPKSEWDSAYETSFHIEAFFQNVSARLANQIPLITQNYVLFEVADVLKAEMMELIQGKENLDVLLQERDDMSNRRRNLKEGIARLQAAQLKLKSFHD
ncbi:interferon-induced GTP-binding protein Mx1-like [Rana temporaria]|uniref:interferon-induced GTP-binding protein Mx1-like n=1 Tax=Rana temporaria TaxID=8407 RepID=UPI001AACD79A|nr:interferon-induced GTP-binding protein Mx1-like [Rana temporaria]